MTDHNATPNPDAMSGAVFTTCTMCSVPVWREDDGIIWQHVEDAPDNDETTDYTAPPAYTPHDERDPFEHDEE